jgi:ABC-type histidine transport system ATPase subunit
MDKSPALLRVHDLQAWYGQSHVLHGVSLEWGAARSSVSWAATARDDQPCSRP